MRYVIVSCFVNINVTKYRPETIFFLKIYKLKGLLFGLRFKGIRIYDWYNIFDTREHRQTIIILILFTQFRWQIGSVATNSLRSLLLNELESAVYRPHCHKKQLCPPFIFNHYELMSKTFSGNEWWWDSNLFEGRPCH